MKPILLSATAVLALTGSTFATVLADFNGGTISGTSSYFVSPTMTETGSYNVVSYETLHPSWADFYDHSTGDETGGFMVVNGASGVGGGMAWSGSVSVTAGADYTVAAWFASVYGFATSSLKFVVIADTTLTGPGFGAPTVTATWAQSSYTFNAGSATSITIQIWDISGLADGNDYAIDDITLELVPAPGPLALAALGALFPHARRRRV